MIYLGQEPGYLEGKGAIQMQMIKLQNWLFLPLFSLSFPSESTINAGHIIGQKNGGGKLKHHFPGGKKYRTQNAQNLHSLPHSLTPLPELTDICTLQSHFCSIDCLILPSYTDVGVKNKQRFRMNREL